MTIRQAMDHLGPWQVALALNGDEPWRKACRNQAHDSDDPATTEAWRALADASPVVVRQVLAAERIVI